MPYDESKPIAQRDLKALGNIINEKLITISERLEPLTYHNPEAHNAIYRGKNLGTFTEAQSAAIRAGTFGGTYGGVYADIYPGDYWVFSNIPYTYYYETSDTTAQAGKTYYADATGTALETQPETGADISGAGYFEKLNATYSGTMRVADLRYFDQNSVVVLPDKGLFLAAMNDKNTTEGGYFNSKMKQVHLYRALAIFEACFGANHISPHVEYLINATNNGVSVGSVINYTSKCELMTEQQLYGSRIYSNPNDSYKATIGTRQFALFQHSKQFMIASANRSDGNWLRDVSNSTSFCSHWGYVCFRNSASELLNVRPYALIY